MTSGEGWSLEGGWEGNEVSILVEAIEETRSYRRDIRCIETSLRQTRQGTLLVKPSEELVSYCGDIRSIETSRWQTH